jgi:hypothetical protein
MTARFTEYSSADLLRGVAWFDQISPGLGDDFEQDFYTALDRIKSNPQHFATDHTGFHPCPLKRFTAVLYFRILDDGILIVGLFTSGEDETELQYRGSPCHAE